MYSRWVLDSWLDKRSILKMSLWVLGKCDEQFSLFLGNFMDWTINHENTLQINREWKQSLVAALQLMVVKEAGVWFTSSHVITDSYDIWLHGSNNNCRFTALTRFLFHLQCCSSSVFHSREQCGVFHIIHLCEANTTRPEGSTQIDPTVLCDAPFALFLLPSLCVM